MNISLTTKKTPLQTTGVSTRKIEHTIESNKIKERLTTSLPWLLEGDTNEDRQHKKNHTLHFLPRGLTRCN